MNPAGPSPSYCWLCFLIAASLLGCRPGQPLTAADQPATGSYRDLVVSAAERPPEGWTRKPPFHAQRSQAAAIGDKLGGRVVDVWNTEFEVGGHKLKVNTLDCAGEEDARRIHAELQKIHRNPAFAVRDGKTVIEFVGSDIRTVLKAAYVLRIKPSVVDYQISFRAAPITGCDYMQWNRLFNLFLQLENNNPQAAEEIADLAGKFSFGSQLAFRRMGLGAAPSKFELTPAAQSESTAGDGEIVVYTFDKLPLEQKVPMVGVVANVRSDSFAITPSRREPAAPELLAATSFWPSDDAKTVELAQRIMGSSRTTEQKTQALLDWLMPGANLRYDGRVTGSRYGVPRVLEQKYGHCWDFSDCFVTLARADGVPCRQVFGWLADQSGHVWAEVLVEGRGWMQVDPTAGMQCTAEYIPYVVSEDGRMPMVYTSSVTIERQSERQ